MAQVTRPSPQGLHWVRQELGSSLQRARDFIESYLEAPANSLPLQRSLVELHQIRGTLRMVQCEGAALLAEEMKKAVQDLLKDLERAPEKAFEALLGSTLQLADYLDLIVAGETDNALIFLPIINELRVARGAGVVSEWALFAQYAGMLGGVPHAPPLQGRADNAGQAVAKQRLGGFQSALLHLLKDQDVATARQRLTDITQAMAAAVNSGRGVRMFNAADAVLAALDEGRLEADLEIKRLLGRVGQQLKNAADSGDATLDELPDTLLFGLVYFAGRSESDNPSVQALVTEYNLQTLLPTPARLEALRARLRGPSTGLVTKLSAEIKADIAEVKDSIDLVVRAGDKAQVNLEDTAAVANGVADTLGMLGLDMLKRMVTNQAQAITSLAQSGERSVDAWVDVAQALLSVEQSLDAALFQHLHSRAPASAETDIAPREDIDAGTAAIYREALVNISRVKNLIPDYLDRGESGHLRQATHLLHEVEAGLDILGEEEGCSLLGRLRTFIASEAMQRLRTSESTVVLLADAVASAEYYLEALSAGRSAARGPLERASAYVSTLEELSIQEGGYSEPASKHVADAPAPQQDPASQDDLPAGTVDPEIHDVFLEEAADVLHALQRDVPVWSRNVDESGELLTNIRRAFHTLKGSGRMVGATRIGEFGWALEYLLNRCLEQAIATSSEVVQVVQQAVTELPTLIEDFRENVPQSDASAGISEVIAQADKLSGRASEAGTTDAAQASPVDELFAIFRADTHKHIQTLRAYSQEFTPFPVSADLLRALHTLKGSAEAVHAPEIAHLAGALEQYADASRAAQQPMQDPAMAVIAHAANVIETRADELQNGADQAQTASEIESLIGQVAELAAKLPASAMEDSSQRELVIIFTDEASDLLDEIELALSEWSSTPTDPRHARQVQGLCHKLKGSARTSDASAIAAVVEALEASVKDYARDAIIPSSQAFARLHEVVNGVYDMIDGFRHGDRDGDAQALIALLGESDQPQESPVVPPSTAAEDEPLSAHADPELVNIFLDEADELLQGIHTALERWSEKPEEEQPRLELMRHLHTLKGGARMAGVDVVGDLSHAMEGVVESAVTPIQRRDAGLIESLAKQADQLHTELDAARVRISSPDISETVAPEPSEEVPDESVERQPEAQEQAEPVAEFDGRLFWQPEASEPEAGMREDTARVGVVALDNMLNQAAEISIYRARMEQQNTGLQFQLREMLQTTSRLREQLRTLDMETEAQIMARHESSADRYEEEFDPLEMDRYSTLHELSRGLAESVTDLGSLHGYMSDLVEQGETLLSQQGRINTDLQQGLMRTLMVPFSDQVQRLQRILRQVSEEYGRRARIEFSGVEAELDRNVLERMAAPMEHLLRNAIIHGLETPEQRSEAGKSATGLVSVTLYREGSQLVIAVRDDGSGLDMDAIRNAAIARKLLRENGKIDNADLAAFIFEPGFSTATELTQAAGRGVGLDVVNAQIKQLGGGMTVDTQTGVGTTFTIRLPVTLAITQALLVGVGDETYAVPIGSVEGVTRVAQNKIDEYLDSESSTFTYGGLSYRMLGLANLLGGGSSAASEEEEAPRSLPVLLARTGDRRTAFVVDKMLGSREVVVKSVGPQVSTVPGISGATVRADGQVILILDVSALMQLQVRQALGTSAPEEVPDVTDDRPLVMVVDDSITIRRVSERLLGRNGMRVVTAKDGMDALAKLKTNTPDAVLLDIEMPRIDGFELATYLRNNESLKSIPIIMITSRSGDKHRRRAEQIGVDRFLTKPYQDQELLSNLHDVMRIKPNASNG